MTPIEPPPTASAPMSPVSIEERELFDVQLRVARRADAISRRRGATTPEEDRGTWLRAECEVFECVENARR